MTLQREANAQLGRLNKIKSDFVSIVDHEFRTPLTSIQGFSEIIRDEELTREEVTEYAADINAEAQRLSRLIDDMLDLDRMEAGRLTLHREPVDLNTLITELSGDMRPSAAAETALRAHSLGASDQPGHGGEQALCGHE